MKRIARLYFLFILIGAAFLLVSGFLTDQPTIGPVFAVIGMGLWTVAIVFAIIVIPIKALTLREKKR